MIKIKIWSDINCPFCYIGKRHLEAALKQFKGDEVVIEWKSFELDPTANPPKGVPAVELLARKYGRDINWAREMNANVTAMAQKAGLNFQLDKLVPANSFNAHRIIHLAKNSGKQDQMKEALLNANFTEGKDISDNETLVSIASSVGLPESDVRRVLSSDEYASDVRQDEKEARALQISGVPFFVFNQKYAASGAQPPEAFLEILSKLSDA